MSYRNKDVYDSDDSIYDEVMTTFRLINRDLYEDFVKDIIDHETYRKEKDLLEEAYAEFVRRFNHNVDLYAKMRDAGESWNYKEEKEKFLTEVTRGPNSLLGSMDTRRRSW